MILYEVIKRQINALHMMEGVTGIPMEITMGHSIWWLGDITGDMFPVQIRASKSALGWLYSNASMVLYRLNGEVYECSLTSLKGMAELQLKEKRITNEPQENAMTKDLFGEITGYLDMTLVFSISNHIK